RWPCAPGQGRGDRNLAVPAQGRGMDGQSMSRRYRLIEKDGQLEIEPTGPTPAMVAASRRNGLRGGRPRKAGTGPQRRISASADAALGQIVKAHPKVGTVGEALDLLLGEKSVQIVLGLLTRKPNSAKSEE